jgi:CubicO group peptidase (beta-lactamase class C family)
VPPEFGIDGAPCETTPLSDLDAPVVSFFPEYADLRTPENDRITLRHLLAMTSGLDWPERAISINNWANIVRQGRSASDPYRFVLARPVETTPGTAWNYNSGGVWLLGLITEEGLGTANRRIRRRGASRASRDTG